MYNDVICQVINLALDITSDLRILFILVLIIVCAQTFLIFLTSFLYKFDEYNTSIYLRGALPTLTFGNPYILSFFARYLLRLYAVHLEMSEYYSLLCKVQYMIHIKDASYYPTCMHIFHH